MNNDNEDNEKKIKSSNRPKLLARKVPGQHANTYTHTHGHDSQRT